MTTLEINTKRRGGRGRKPLEPITKKNYRQLRNPFTPQTVFTEDRVAAIHDTALTVLEDLGMLILLKEARDILAANGALVDHDTMMVRIGRDMVTAALKFAPRSIRLRAASPERELDFEPGSMIFAAGSGCPNATDLVRGRRPGSLRDFEEAIKLQQSFDVIHKHSASAEPQDVPNHLRHYAMMRAQMVYGDKPVFVYARGQAQVLQSFEMIRLARGLDEAEFTNGVWASTVINTNSPRQLDLPMGQGIIDFARAMQMSIITPFCLAGAMAPVTVTGALTLQHAEALAGITLAQMTKSGAPVAYGAFSSNVDMKSGAPAFGTPEHIQACLGSGQLARFIGLPWRSATGASSNAADAQGTHETVMALWGTALSGATLTMHAAGWLEGGLSFGYEKFILDIEALQTFAELCQTFAADDDDMAMRAIADVQPGGHFFATPHTMERYREAFYEPLVADLSNYGSWHDAGGKTATQRATAIWQQKLADYTPPVASADADQRLAAYIADKSAAGGAKPFD